MTAASFGSTPVANAAVRCGFEFDLRQAFPKEKPAKPL
jgi:hypothetical protein